MFKGDETGGKEVEKELPRQGTTKNGGAAAKRFPISWVGLIRGKRVLGMGRGR